MIDGLCLGQVHQQGGQSGFVTMIVRRELSVRCKTRLHSTTLSTGRTNRVQMDMVSITVKQQSKKFHDLASTTVRDGHLVTHILMRMPQTSNSTITANMPNMNDRTHPARKPSQ